MLYTCWGGADLDAAGGLAFLQQRQAVVALAHHAVAHVLGQQIEV